MKWNERKEESEAKKKDIDRLNKNKEPRGRILGALKVAATYSPTTQCSTIGDAELNDPVRNGKGWDLSAITTLIIVVRQKTASLKVQRPFAPLIQRRKWL